LPLVSGKSCHQAIEKSVNVVTFNASFEAGFRPFSFKLCVLTKFYVLSVVIMSVSVSGEFPLSRCKEWHNSKDQPLGS